MNSKYAVIIVEYTNFKSFGKRGQSTTNFRWKGRNVSEDWIIWPWYQIRGIDEWSYFFSARKARKLKGLSNDARGSFCRAKVVSKLPHVAAIWWLPSDTNDRVAGRLVRLMSPSHSVSVFFNQRNGKVLEYSLVVPLKFLQELYLEFEKTN